MRAYLYGVMVAASMLVNVIFGGAVGQTLSARQHQRKRDKQWNIAKLIDWLCGENHCLQCWCYWKVRKW